MNRGGHLICWAIALLAAASPLPFGSVGPLSVAALQIAVFALTLAWIAMRRRLGLAALPWRDPILLGGAALLAYGLFQIVPLPSGLAALLSPEAARLRAVHAPLPSDWICLSIDPYATWTSCLRIACFALVALLVRHNAVDLKGRLITGSGLAAGGLFQAGYGLFEFISGRQHIFGYAKKYFTDVATGTFISRNNYAGYLEMAIPMSLALALVALGRARRASAPGELSLKRRLAGATGRQSFHALLLMMAAFLMATALLMSRSRMGIVSIGVALLAGGLAVGLRGRSRRFAAASVGVVLVAAIFATQIDILPVLDRFDALKYEMGGGYGRWQVWRQTVPMLEAYPLFGSGLGTWEEAFSPFRDDRAQVRVDRAHNDYLEFAAESGLAGVAILVVVVCLLLRSSRRAWRDGLARDEITLGAAVGLMALALHSATDFHFAIPADALACAALAGLLLPLAWPSRPTARGAEAAPGRRAVRPRSAVAAFASVALLLGLGLAAASPAAARMTSLADPESRGSSRAGGPDDVGDVDAGGVIPTAASPDDDLCPDCSLEPYNAARWIEASSRARRRLLKDVEALLRAQSAGDLADPAVRLYLARRLDAARALAERGLSLSPAMARGHLEAGLLWFGRFALIGLPPEASDDFARARESFEKALALQPWRAASHRKVARVLSPLWEECAGSDREFIARVARRAIELDPSAADLQAVAGKVGA